MISASQRPLPDNTQHSQQTNIHFLGGIRTHNLSRRAAVGPRLRPHSPLERHKNTDTYLLIKNLLYSDGSYHSKWIDTEVNIVDANRKVHHLNAGSNKHSNLVVGANVFCSRISVFDLYTKERFLCCTSLLSLSASRQIHDSIFE